MNLLQKENSIFTVQQPMVVSQSQIHHWSSNDLITFHHWSVDNRVHAQDGALRWVQDRSAHEGAEGASVGDSEVSSLHVFDGNFTFFSFFGEVTKSLLELICTFSKSWNFMFWQFLSTGTRSPVGVATAIEISI